MAKKKSSLRCPTCRKIVLATDPDFPFCSGRCRVIDLGKWISGGYVISSPVNDPESGGEARYNEPGYTESGYNEKRLNRIGGPRQGPEAPASAGESSTGESSADESEMHGRRKPN